MIKRDKQGRWWKIERDSQGNTVSYLAYSTLPEMTEESGRAYRDTLKASGCLQDDARGCDPYDGRPYSSVDSLMALRVRLIASGHINPEQPLADAFTPKQEDVSNG